MFQTLQPQKFRINRTAQPGPRRKLYLTQQLCRPQTVNTTEGYYFNEQNSHLNQTSNFAHPHQQTVNFKTIDMAELELNHSFKQQMNPYIKEKIKQLNNRFQKKVYFSSKPIQWNNMSKQKTLNSNLNPENTFNFTNNTSILSQTISNSPSPVNVKQMKLCTILNRQSKSPINCQTVVDQGIINNTKQKISRLIQAKNEKQQRYISLSQSIKKRANKKYNQDFSIHLRRKSLFVEPKPHIEKENWDEEWRAKTANECNRYRSRVVAKHKRDFSIQVKHQLQAVQ